MTEVVHKKHSDTMWTGVSPLFPSTENLNYTLYKEARRDLSSLCLVFVPPLSVVHESLFQIQSEVYN
jgi:hypothetical protein